MNSSVETGNSIICEVKLKYKMYPKVQHHSGDWVIITADVVNVFEGEPQVHPEYDTITLKGVLPKFNYLDTYKIVGKEFYDNNYKNYYYKILYFGKPMNLENEKQQKIFLTHVLTKTQLKNFYQKYNSPFEIIKNENIDKITQVKGIGVKTAYKIIDKYKQTIDLSPIFVELDSYGLTTKMIDKLLEIYSSPQLIVDEIKKNPYILATKIKGIGWNKADEMALKSGISIDSPFRIKSFIINTLEKQAQKGNSYVDPGDLFYKMLYELGKISKKKIKQTIEDMYDKEILWCDRKMFYNNQQINKVQYKKIKQQIKNNKKINLNLLKKIHSTKVGLKKYYDLEKNICKELIRINNGENNFKYKNWEERIKRIEKIQGWKYNEEQKKGIHEALKHQVIMITGGAGSGKSSIVNGIIQVLENYDYVQTALSGRAAARMSEITGEKGYTIHRLLGTQPPHKEFIHNNQNPLINEIYIVDEISMVGGYLFYDLIQAIPTNSKLILLGDINQLEAIGCMNLAKDILESKKIHNVVLTKIHRQALNSAIKTESFKIKDGIPLYKKGWIGYDIRGKMQDFELDVYNNKDLTVNKCLKYFKKYLQLATDITEIQVLASVKERGEASVYNLNNKIQQIYNPKNNNKKEIKLFWSKDKNFFIRENDKIMITRNNYKTLNEDGILSPIFNGQQGIVKKIDLIENIIYISIPYVSDKLILIPKNYWNNIILGYAMTVHKSQGSQYEYVIGCIDYSMPPNMLVKELLYTLMTRASKHCVICGETKALYKAMTNSFVSTKKTFLKDMLDNLIN